jgi:hypothetical protein
VPVWVFVRERKDVKALLLGNSADPKQYSFLVSYSPRFWLTVPLRNFYFQDCECNENFSVFCGMCSQDSFCLGDFLGLFIIDSVFISYMIIDIYSENILDQS